MESLSSALKETDTLIELMSGSRDGMHLRAIVPGEQERLKSDTCGLSRREAQMTTRSSPGPEGFLQTEEIQRELLSRVPI